MRKTRSFKMLSGMLAAAALVALPMSTPAAEAKAPVQEQRMGMPNPMVEYPSVEEAAKTAGYIPLSLPKLSGYYAENIYVIAGDLVDIRYVRSDDSNVKLLVRSAPANLMQDDDISGVYGAKWKVRTIRDIPVSIARTDGTESSDAQTYAAHWQVGDYLFAVQSEGLSYPAFTHMLEDGLLDLSINYFSRVERRSLDDDAIPYRDKK